MRVCKILHQNGVDFKNRGLPYLDSGDKIKIIALDDTEYITYIFNHSYFHLLKTQHLSLLSFTIIMAINYYL